jgi:dihydropteroate synthase
VNDVAALTYDPALGPLVAARGAPVVPDACQGTPATMQDDPRYDDVLLDVYDCLADRLAAAEALGIPRARIAVDPGIGFGKTLQHNLALLRGLSLFHGLGCPILLGTSAQAVHRHHRRGARGAGADARGRLRWRWQGWRRVCR